MKYFYLFLLLFLVVLQACSPKGPYAFADRYYKKQAKGYLKIINAQQPDMLTDSTGRPIPSEWVGSVNFGIRKPDFVIIHFTAQDSAQQTLKTFTLKRTDVSANYVVAKNGKVYHMVNDYLRAYHAGLGKWGKVVDMNSCSVGIEIDNNGSEPFTAPQLNSLLALLAQLKAKYHIPQTNFIGHEDFAPKRKPDPGPYFPWQLLAQHGYGYWSDDVLELAPPDFDYITALKLIGYDTSDITAAVVAFKRHFVQTDVRPVLTQLDLNILYNVYQKYE